MLTSRYLTPPCLCLFFSHTTASVAGIRSITDRMLYTAAVACADSMTPDCIAEGRTFPKIQDIREGASLLLCPSCIILA